MRVAVGQRVHMKLSVNELKTGAHSYAFIPATVVRVGRKYIYAVSDDGDGKEHAFDGVTGYEAHKSPSSQRRLLDDEGRRRSERIEEFTRRVRASTLALRANLYR